MLILLNIANSNEYIKTNSKRDELISNEYIKIYKINIKYKNHKRQISFACYSISLNTIKSI